MSRPGLLSLLLAQRSWQAFAGLVSVALVTHVLSPLDQGWYYAFMSVAAVSTLFDVGLSLVLVQASARNSAQADGASANAELTRSYLHVYAVAAGAYCLVSLALGWLTFVDRGAVGVYTWLPPWIALNIFVAANLLVTPFFAVEEGAGSQRRVYVVRLAQSIVGALGAWGALICAGPLWGCVAAPLCSFAVAVGWIWKERSSALFAAVRVAGPRPRPASLGPWQAQAAVSWISGYLLIQVAPPILFRLHSAEEAGRMGLSLAFANMVGVLAQSAIAARLPAMTRLVEQRRWLEFDQTFRKALLQSLALFLGLATPLAVLRYCAESSHLAARLIDPHAFGLLLCAVLASHVCSALAAQLRSFQTEPLVWIALAGGIVSLLLTLAIAPDFGAGGVTQGYFGVQSALLTASVFVWRRQNAILRT